MNKRIENGLTAVTHLVCNSNANNRDTETLDESHLVAQTIGFTCWIAISDENDDIWHTRIVSVGSLEYFCPSESQAAGRIGVFIAIMNTSNCVKQWPSVGKVGQVEL